jgi:hypothetical protein
MRDQSGQDLDWFWREWLFTTARLDQAVDSVAARGDSLIEVYLSNRGQMVMPVGLALKLENPDHEVVTKDVGIPVEMWNLGPRFTYRYRGPGKLLEAIVDPEERLPDVNRGNNRWSR